MCCRSTSSSPRPSATPLNQHVEPLYLEPLPLYPQQSIPQARNSRRRVRAREGHGTDSSRRVLEPVHMKEGSRAYAIDRLIRHQPKTGAAILLATPLMTLGTSSDDGVTPLVSCGDQVVIKAVPQPTTAAFVDNPLAEVAALQLLGNDDDQSSSHQRSHVIQLIDCLQDQEYVYLVLPYLSGGDLFSRVEEYGDEGLPEAEAASYLRQICEGLLFMKQSCGLAHHDLSLENVMMENGENGRVKIIDLGMCLRVPREEEDEQEVRRDPKAQPIWLTSQRCRGKPGYVAPEVVYTEPCDPFAADIWSLGVSVYIMLTGRPIYTKPADVAFKAMARGGTLEIVTLYEKHGLILSPLAKDLVCRMLAGDARKRPTLEEVLTHPFLTNHALQADHPSMALMTPNTSSNPSSSLAGKEGASMESETAEGMSPFLLDSPFTQYKGEIGGLQ